MTWIVRIFLVLAAPIAGLLVARDTLNFSIVQTFVAILLMVGCIALAALWSGARRRQ